jgi:hypothetical protein
MDRHYNLVQTGEVRSEERVSKPKIRSNDLICFWRKRRHDLREYLGFDIFKLGALVQGLRDLLHEEVFGFCLCACHSHRLQLSFEVSNGGGDGVGIFTCFPPATDRAEGAR